MHGHICRATDAEALTAGRPGEGGLKFGAGNCLGFRVYTLLRGYIGFRVEGSGFREMSDVCAMFCPYTVHTGHLPARL